MGALTVKTSPEYAMKHGACKINEKVRRGGRKGGGEGWSGRRKRTKRSGGRFCGSSGAMSCLVTQGEFARVVHRGPEEVVRSLTQPDGTCDMVRGGRGKKYTYMCTYVV